MKNEVTKFIGVYERQSAVRKHNGRPDVCFNIAYQFDGKLTWEKTGWLSEGYSSKLSSQIRAERIRSIRHGKELPKQKQKIPYFKDIAKKYLEWASTNKAGSRDDLYRYRKHLAPLFDNKRLNEISSFDLERLKSKLVKKGLAAATIGHCLTLFRHMINKSIEWRLYKGENPIKGVKMPKIQNKRERYLSHDESDLLLKELAKISVQLHDEALLSLHCGLRASEVFRLTWNDVDVEHGLLTLRDAKSGTRIGYMTKAVKNMLAGRKLFAENQIIFPKNTGTVQKQVSNTFRRVVNKLGFNNGVVDRRQKFVFHSLRHTFASWHVQSGTDLYTLQKLMGHADFKMVQRYAHLSEGTMHRAVENLEKSMLPEEDIKKVIAIK